MIISGIYGAILDIHSNKLYNFSDVFGYIEATSFESKIWLSRILGMFPNVMPIKLGFDSYQNHNYPDIILTSLETLKISNRIWLEEFYQEPTQEQILALNKATSILTPSLTNSILLKSLFPDKNIELCSLAYPSISQNKNSNDYAIYFEKDVRNTSFLLKTWKDKYPTLLVIGSNLKLLSNMRNVCEYESYTDLLKMITSAKFCIDLNMCNHYISGVADVCKSISVPVITNNHNYIMKEGFKVIRPSMENFQTSIEEVCGRAKINLSNIDENSSRNNMLTLLGK